MPEFSVPMPAMPDIVQVTFPAPHIVHVAMNRPKQYNAMNHELNTALTDIFDWFEAEPSLWVAILGSTNRKAWCAGADLKAWQSGNRMRPTRTGFGGISERITKKPIIGAVNGFALGGGSEMVVNLDMVIAGQGAVFGFPEVKRGVFIGLGGLPRFVRLVGHPVAVECILTGRNIPAKEALSLRMINEVVPDDDVENRALDWAKEIAGNSPDSVIAQLNGIRIAEESPSVIQAQRLFIDSVQIKALDTGENIKEGLLAFKEKRKPNWISSKL